MKLCEWCEQPVEGDNELCHKCLDAQARVESGNLIPAEPDKKQLPDLSAQVGSGLLFCGKLFASAVLSVVMIITALAGTCATLVTLFTLTSFWAFGYAAIAAVAFYVTYLLFRLTQKMVFGQPLRRIERPKDSPPTIERKD